MPNLTLQTWFILYDNLLMRTPMQPVGVFRNLQSSVRMNSLGVLIAISYKFRRMGVFCGNTPKMYWWCWMHRVIQHFNRVQTFSPGRKVRISYLRMEGKLKLLRQFSTPWSMPCSNTIINPILGSITNDLKTDIICKHNIIGKDLRNTQRISDICA